MKHLAKKARYKDKANNNKSFSTSITTSSELLSYSFFTSIITFPSPLILIAIFFSLFVPVTEFISLLTLITIFANFFTPITISLSIFASITTSPNSPAPALLIPVTTFSGF